MNKISTINRKQISWKKIPSMPVEIMSLPQWFPFHINKISYWSRTVVVPLLIILDKKPKAKNPKNINIKELFINNKKINVNYLLSAGDDYELIFTSNPKHSLKIKREKK